MATGGVTQSGVIYNGGFDDGVIGDCFFLSNNLPNWKWYGGSNAGFVGSPEAGFTRTGNRKDYAVAPPADTPSRIPSPSS